MTSIVSEIASAQLNKVPVVICTVIIIDNYRIVGLVSALHYQARIPIFSCSFYLTLAASEVFLHTVE